MKVMRPATLKIITVITVMVLGAILVLSAGCVQEKADLPVFGAGAMITVAPIPTPTLQQCTGYMDVNTADFYGLSEVELARHGICMSGTRSPVPNDVGGATCNSDCKHCRCTAPFAGHIPSHEGVQFCQCED